MFDATADRRRLPPRGWSRAKARVQMTSSCTQRPIFASNDLGLVKTRGDECRIHTIPCNRNTGTRIFWPEFDYIVTNKIMFRK